jgi:poly(3-hydroxyalkanoate) synthetase
MLLSSSHNLSSSTGKYRLLNSTNTMPIKKNQDVERAEEETMHQRRTSQTGRYCWKNEKQAQKPGVVIKDMT